MDTPEDAATCVEQLNGTPLDGKNITVAFAKRGRARTPTPGQYHGYKLDDRRPYDGGRGGYGGGGGGGYRGGSGYGMLLLSHNEAKLMTRPTLPA
jgi:transformer-2 protein